MKTAPLQAPWPAEIAGGTVAALVVLAVVLTLGLLGFSPLGPAAAQVGIPAAFVTVSVGGLVFAILGRSAMPAGGPSSATALIVAGLLAQLVGDPEISLADSRDVASFVTVVSVTVFLMGAAQAAMAAINLGSLVKFVPQPVRAGFMSGGAILVVLSQVPTLLGQGETVVGRLEPSAGLEHLARDLGMLGFVGIEKRQVTDAGAEEQHRRDQDPEEPWLRDRPVAAPSSPPRPDRIARCLCLLVEARRHMRPAAWRQPRPRRRRPLRIASKRFSTPSRPRPRAARYANVTLYF